MTQHNSTTRDLRRLNRSKALKSIYFNGPLSRVQVGRATELSPATVTNVVAELLADNILLESGLIESDGGRPSTLLKINPEYGYFIGIDVGETLIQIGLFDLTLKKLNATHYPLSLTENQQDQVVEHIVSGVEDLLSLTGIEPNRIIGVGIGFPGLVDPEAGVSVFAPNWGWHDVPIRSLLDERLGLPMLLDNGAKTMALAESMLGVGKGAGSLAVVLVGTGIGAGIVSNGSIYRGASNYAGELGHTTIELDGYPCRCGSRGCLEAYAGVPAILRRYLELVPDSSIADERDQMKAIESLLVAARHGEIAACKVVSDTARYLGVGIANLINLYNPQQVALGGWAGLMLWPAIENELLETVERYALVQPLQRTNIGLCQLGHEAVTLGAATLALEAFLESAGSKQRLKQVNSST